jgi:Septum formation
MDPSGPYAPPPPFPPSGSATPPGMDQNGAGSTSTKLLAVAVVGLFALGVGLWVRALLGGDSDSGTDEAEQPGEADPSLSPADRLEIGDCFANPHERPVREIEPISCSEPHGAEVFLVTEHPAPPGAPFPGQGTVESDAMPMCAASFDYFVGRPFRGSSLGIYVMQPSESTWDFYGDRTLVCAVFDPADNRMTSSLEGANR